MAVGSEVYYDWYIFYWYHWGGGKEKAVRLINNSDVVVRRLRADK